MGRGLIICFAQLVGFDLMISRPSA